MLALLRTVSGRYLQLHGLRTALVVASIALGVATLVATRALNQSMVEAASGAATPLQGASDLLVTNGEQGVHRDVIQEIRDSGIPGIKAVIPLIFGRLTIPSLNNRPAVLVGVELDESSLRQLRDLYGLNVPIDLRPSTMKNAYRVFLGSLLATELNDNLAGFEVRVEGNRMQPMACIGTVEGQGAASALAGNIVVASLTDAVKILGWDQRANPCVTRVDLLLEQGTDRDAVSRSVAALLGTRAEVRTPEFNNQTVHKVMAGLELGFQLCGLCALGVGFLLVFMVLTVSVAERRHDIGIMRSLGATRRQIVNLFLSEAAVLGFIGSMLGVPLGLGLAYLFLGPFQRTLSNVFVPLKSRHVAVEPATIVVAVVVGIVISMIAALVPALRSANEEPADAVRRAPPRENRRGRFTPALIALGLISVGLAFYLFRVHFSEQRYGTYGAIFFTFLGTVVATIPLAAIAARLIQPIVRILFGVEERLAADNITRSPLRAGLVIAILAAFVALMMQTAGVIHSSKVEILSWVDRSIAAPLLVTANSPITASGQNLAMKQYVGENIATLPEVSRYVSARYRQVDYGAERVFLIALDTDFSQNLQYIRDPVPGLDKVDALREPSTCLVSENFAMLHHVREGDKIKVRGSGGEVELRVIGTALDYSWNRGTVIMSREHYVKYFDDPLIDIFNVYLRGEDEQTRLKLSAALSSNPMAPFPAALPMAYLCQSPGPRQREEVSDTIRRYWGAEEDLWVMTQEELRKSIEDMIQRLYSIGYVQEAVVGLVAAMGVVTALLISVLQRRRELGLLRAVGASRSQILRTVLAEAIVLGLIGAVLGIAIGIPMEWYAVRVILPEEAGYDFGMVVPWQGVLTVTVLAMLVATLAGLIPALHAVRLHIAESIAYE